MRSLGRVYSKDAPMNWMSYYKDSGCKFHSQCLNCPFEFCRKEESAFGVPRTLKDDKLSCLDKDEF